MYTDFNGHLIEYWNENAPLYDATKTYNVGDVCKKSATDSSTYVCVKRITTPEAYTPSHWGVVPFPHMYMKQGTYKCIPKQREEIKAYRDDYTRNLVRITAQGMKSKITFTIRGGLNLKQVNDIMVGFFKAHYSIEKERKIGLKYWDNENLKYDFGYFYVPNLTFPVNIVQSNDIKHGELEIELIEY